jgi:glutaredoxin-like protein
VTVTEHGEGAFGVDRYPTVVALRDGEDIGIRFHGTPWGYELTSIVGAVLEAGRAEPSLAPETLAGLGRDLAIEVFVTPTCPHCPRAVLLAYRAAAASPRVTAAAVEATEFPQLADRYGVLAVPKIVVNGEPLFEGAVPEQVFVQRLLAYAR